MNRYGVLGATALSLSLAIATPVLAQQQARGGHPGARAAAGAAHFGGAPMGVRSNAQASFQPNGGRATFSGGGRAQFAQRGGEFRGDRGRGFGRDAGIAAGVAAAGVATGAALAAGDYGYADPYYGNYAYDTGYYGDSYAYDTGPAFDVGVAVPVEGPLAVAGDASYCAQRYRSYDPASGTYLGFDGLRHPCM